MDIMAQFTGFTIISSLSCFFLTAYDSKLLLSFYSFLSWIHNLHVVFFFLSQLYQYNLHATIFLIDNINHELKHVQMILN